MDQLSRSLIAVSRRFSRNPVNSSLGVWSRTRQLLLDHHTAEAWLGAAPPGSIGWGGGVGTQPSLHPYTVHRLCKHSSRATTTSTHILPRNLTTGRVLPPAAPGTVEPGRRSPGSANSDGRPHEATHQLRHASLCWVSSFQSGSCSMVPWRPHTTTNGGHTPNSTNETPPVVPASPHQTQLLARQGSHRPDRAQGCCQWVHPSRSGTEHQSWWPTFRTQTRLGQLWDCLCWPGGSSTMGSWRSSPGSWAVRQRPVDRQGSHPSSESIWMAKFIYIRHTLQQVTAIPKAWWVEAKRRLPGPGTWVMDGFSVAKFGFCPTVFIVSLIRSFLIIR